MVNASLPRVVVIGGGFGGLACVRGLRRANADVVLIDKRNFHLFQPLLYQVATGGLSPANIAAPLRAILRKQKNAQVLMESVVDFDFVRRELRFADGGRCPFDYLVVATGSIHHYFGNDQAWEPFAPGLKTIEDATEIRKRILTAFEEAEATDDESARRRLLTFMIVGGGPTGIELAGAICELAQQTMAHDFRNINPKTARVILIENSDRILEKYHTNLSATAKQALIGLGAEVWNETRLMDLGDGCATILRGGTTEKIEVATVLWAAGVRASDLGKQLALSLGDAIELDRSGRVKVNEFCNVAGQSTVYVIGDLACQMEGDVPLPGVAPVAVQQGGYVANRILAQIKGQTSESAFRYWDKGSMATIGRSRAVLEAGRIRLSGKLAWLAWLFIHILYLARFENRVMVLFQWGWNYVTRNRAARLITNVSERIKLL